MGFGSHLQAAGRPKKSVEAAQRPHWRVVVCARARLQAPSVQPPALRGARGVGSTSGALRRPCHFYFVEKRTSHLRRKQEGHNRRADLLRWRIRLLAEAMLAFSADAARAVPRACPSTRRNWSATPSVRARGKARGQASPRSRLQLTRCLHRRTRASLRFSQQRGCVGQYCALRTGGSTVV